MVYKRKDATGEPSKPTDEKEEEGKGANLN